MALARCPHCNSPLGLTEAAGSSCPVCNGTLASAIQAAAPQPQGSRPSTGDYSTPVPVARAVGAKPLASILSRLFARIVDGVIAVIAMTPGIILLVMATVSIQEAEVKRVRDFQDMPPQPGQRLPNQELTPEQISALITGYGVLFGGLALIGLIQMVLLSMSGQSIGKKLLGIRIVNYVDGSNPGFVGAFAMREFLPALINCCVGGLFNLVDILFIFSEERRCLHDLIAGTKVVLA